MDLSIVIVSWNTRKLLEGCLSSIYANPPRDSFEVFVVDNASADGSVEMLRESFPQVQIIENSKNIGFARANNQAIERTKGRYLLLLNPDTEIKADALKVLVKFMDEHPEAGAAGSRLINSDGSIQVSCSPAPTLFRELWRLFHLDRIRPYGVYDMENWGLESPRPVDVLQGACLILRRPALDQVGLLDEGYFMYSEEVDLCYRIKQAGFFLYWVPGARVIHYGAESTKQIAMEMFLHLYQSKILYFRKHHGHIAAWIYKLILFGAAFSRLILTPIAFLERRQIRQGHLTLSNQYRHLLWMLPSL